MPRWNQCGVMPGHRGAKSVWQPSMAFAATLLRLQGHKRQAGKPHLLPKLVMYTTAGVLFLKSWMVLVSSAVNARCACATSPGPVHSTCCPGRAQPSPTLLPGPSRTRMLHSWFQVAPTQCCSSETLHVICCVVLPGPRGGPCSVEADGPRPSCGSCCARERCDAYAAESADRT